MEYFLESLDYKFDTLCKLAVRRHNERFNDLFATRGGDSSDFLRDAPRQSMLLVGEDAIDEEFEHLKERAEDGLDTLRLQPEESDGPCQPSDIEHVTGRIQLMQDHLNPTVDEKEEFDLDG